VRPNHFAVLEVDDVGDRGLGLDAALPPAGAEAADRDDPIAEVAELGKLVTKARHGVAVGLERLADTSRPRSTTASPPSNDSSA
jgi:hypothetical protein